MTLAEKVKAQFAIGMRWPNGGNDMPIIIAMCKRCGSLWTAQDVYSLMRWVSEHLTNFPCPGLLVSSDFSSEVEKVLKALERAE